MTKKNLTSEKGGVELKQKGQSMLSKEEDESITILIEENLKLSTQIDNLTLDNKRLQGNIVKLTQEKEDLEILVEAISDHSEQLNDDLMAKVELAQRDALTDALTLIPNRRFFDQHLEMEWHRATRIKSVISILMIDIDFFKHYNDYYGHLKGDECLREVAGLINSACHRETDFIARYGGEEFAVVISDTEQAGVIKVAERIVENVVAAKIPHAASQISAYVTISLGCFSKIPLSGEDVFDFIHESDCLLYLAKQNGRNRLIHSPITSKVKLK
jgi:diguanylate cyclase (GGDEF)-like protein